MLPVGPSAGPVGSAGEVPLPQVRVPGDGVPPVRSRADPADEESAIPLSVILIVDDEAELRYLLRRIIEGAGHEVVEAGNGADALAQVRRSPPDLVVTDIMMPIMDGVELIRRLRGEPTTNDIPILVVSSHAHLAAPADSVIAKPYTPNTLLAAVGALLARKVDRRRNAF